MRRLWKPLLGLVVVLAAFTISFGWPIENGLQIDLDTSPRALAARQKTPWDLTKLQVMNRVIHQVNDDYVDPRRIDHQRMMLAGLDAIQKDVPPVLVHYRDGADTLTVQVNSAQSEFTVSDVSSPWELAGRFRQVFAFLQEELRDEEDIELSQVEYSAVNGMLKTLDPHTILLPPEQFEEMRTSTRGQFGGLGIVISIRDGHLTVIRPIPDTPAFKAGLERGDRIVKIEDESTLNMPLQEAVNRLRGKPHSKVKIFIRRERSNIGCSAMASVTSRSRTSKATPIVTFTPRWRRFTRSVWLGSSSIFVAIRAGFSIRPFRSPMHSSTTAPL
ncbi:MAG: PDZ domain-containing protein [Deltaproteobacteria bacterium]|nr:PDZ domain-containing protein [Deltaproteobacteria bacterium]